MKTIASLPSNTQLLSVKASDKVIQKCTDYHITTFDLISAVMNLGKDEIERLANEQETAFIHQIEKQFGLIITVHQKNLHIDNILPNKAIHQRTPVLTIL